MLTKKNVDVFYFFEDCFMFPSSPSKIDVVIALNHMHILKLDLCSVGGT